MLENKSDPLASAIEEVEYRVERLESMIKEAYVQGPWIRRREYDHEDLAEKTLELGKAILEALRRMKGKEGERMKNNKTPEGWKTFVGEAFGMTKIDTLVVVATQEDGPFRVYLEGDFIKIFWSINLLKDRLALHGLRNQRKREVKKDGDPKKEDNGLTG